MPTVRYTADGGRYKHRDGFAADPDDREHDVSESFADHLTDNYPQKFERVAGDSENAESGDSGGADAETGGTSDSDDAADEPAGTCDVVKTDGEVCGRELPCQYHSED